MVYIDTDLARQVWQEKGYPSCHHYTITCVHNVREHVGIVFVCVCHWNPSFPYKVTSYFVDKTLRGFYCYPTNLCALVGVTLSILQLFLCHSCGVVDSCIWPQTVGSCIVTWYMHMIWTSDIDIGMRFITSLLATCNNRCSSFGTGWPIRVCWLSQFRVCVCGFPSWQKVQSGLAVAMRWALLKWKRVLVMFALWKCALSKTWPLHDIHTTHTPLVLITCGL